MPNCPHCGEELDCPEPLRRADEGMARALGGTVAEGCDPCAALLVHPDERALDVLLRANELVAEVARSRSRGEQPDRALLDELSALAEERNRLTRPSFHEPA